MTTLGTGSVGADAWSSQTKHLSDDVDLQTASPGLAAAVFDQGVLLVGEPEEAMALRSELADTAPTDRSSHERFDAAVAKIDAHLDIAVTATDGESRDR